MTILLKFKKYTYIVYMPATQKRSRCKNGTRKNKKTGNCESVLDKICSICLDRIVSGNITTKCKHKFHKKCLIGWCKGNKDKPTCPICRKDIKETCKKIMPFDSHEVFRYIRDKYDETPADTARRIEQASIIVQHKDFDPNIKNMSGKSLLYELSKFTFNNTHYKPIIEIIFKKYPNVVVSTELITELIASGNTDILQLYKKYKKIPKSLKSLV